MSTDFLPCKIIGEHLACLEFSQLHWPILFEYFMKLETAVRIWQIFCWNQIINTFLFICYFKLPKGARVLFLSYATLITVLLKIKSFTFWPLWRIHQILHFSVAQGAKRAEFFTILTNKSSNPGFKSALLMSYGAKDTTIFGGLV